MASLIYLLCVCVCASTLVYKKGLPLFLQNTVTAVLFKKPLKVDCQKMLKRVLL